MTKTKYPAALLDDVSIDAILSPAPSPHRENEQLRHLLTWVAWMIHDTDANGKISERFCRLCKIARLKHQKCRHAEIFALHKAIT
jgi:hypothetical protein